MIVSSAADSSQGGPQLAGPYTVYAAGGLFNEQELAANVLVKEAVWRLSDGRFRLFLPQSNEPRDLDRPDKEAFIRNDDLSQVLKADALIARFDGLELDSGTVVEYIVAKCLGKPTVLLRCDYRRLSSTGPDEPYNLMVKNWPRTVEVHIDASAGYAGLLAQEREALGESDSFQSDMQAELGTVQKCIDAVARALIDGLEAALKMGSPYPPEVQETVYRAFRYTPGSGFDQLLTEDGLDEVLQRLRTNGTL
jgi:nucleoside 2-deoxyribosyltransferase